MGSKWLIRCGGRQLPFFSRANDLRRKPRNAMEKRPDYFIGQMRHQRACIS
jgi:hypothetical protein